MSGTTNIPTVGVILRRHGKMLVFKRLNTGYEDGKYCLPAGHVEYGENYRQAGVREVMEEVGISLTPDQLLHAHTMQTMDEPDNIRTQIFFEVADWQGEPAAMEPEKHGQPEWLSEQDLTTDNSVPFMAVALQRMRQGLAYSELGW